MFLQNKYARWYFQIIDKRRLAPVEGYSEKHHVIPACLGGSNSLENVVSLTAREHFICHLLLTKMVNGQARHKMIHAVWLMANMISDNQQRQKITGRTLAHLRKMHSIAIGNALRGRRLPEEQRAKYRKPKSNQARLNMSAGRLGIVFTDRHRKSLSTACSGKFWINNGYQSKMIQTSVAEEHFAKGWIKGRITLNTAEAVQKRISRKVYREQKQTENRLG